MEKDNLQKSFPGSIATGTLNDHELRYEISTACKQLENISKRLNFYIDSKRGPWREVQEMQMLQNELQVVLGRLNAIVTATETNNA